MEHPHPNQSLILPKKGYYNVTNLKHEALFLALQSTTPSRLGVGGGEGVVTLQFRFLA